MKRLYRSKSDVMIAGVCSGIAEYLSVDPTAVRLAFVLMFFLGGSGLWIYLVLWIIMPLEPSAPSDSIDVQEKQPPAKPKKVATPKPPEPKEPQQEEKPPETK